ncbi:hypothetical protein HK104_008975 [Borealophlyctis nickersoniae]|nr:hypothetical protein HK104_008975 [Borealophlyctis nickersoniae]
MEGNRLAEEDDGHGGYSVTEENPRKKRRGSRLDCFNPTVALDQCKLLQNDSCCKILVANGGRTPPVTGTPKAGDANAQSSDQGANSSGARTGIIVGVVGVVVVIVGIFAGIMIVRRRRQQKAAPFFAYGNDGGYKPDARASTMEKNDSYAAPRSFGGDNGGRSSAIQMANIQNPPSEPEPAYNSTSVPILSAPPAPIARNDSANVTMRVVHPYNPSLQDELTLEVGDEVVLLKAFDDGWALGLTPANGNQGAFPLVCVSRSDESPRDPEILNAERQSLSFARRVSSQVLSQSFDASAFDQPVPEVPANITSGGASSESGGGGGGSQGTPTQSDPFAAPFDDEHQIAPSDTPSSSPPRPSNPRSSSPVPPPVLPSNLVVSNPDKPRLSLHLSMGSGFDALMEEAKKKEGEEGAKR